MLQEISKCGKWKVYGNLEPKILIAGHSHTFAMYLALQNSKKFLKNIALVTQSDFTAQNPQDNDYWNYVVELSKMQKTAISWNGNQHNIHFLLDANYKFNAFGLMQNKNFPYVSVSRIKEVFKPTFYELGLILSRFSNRNNLCLLGTPAPKTKSFLDSQLQKVSAETFFEDLGASMGISKNNLKASSNELRTFMWGITQQLTEKVGKDFSCDFLSSPKTTQNKDGILLEKYYTDDLTHANEEFGFIMLEAILNKYGIGDE